MPKPLDGYVVVSVVKPHELTLKLPPSFISQLLKKLHLPLQLQYLIPYAEKDAVYLVTHNGIPIAAFVAFIHQGRDLRNSEVKAMTVLALTCRHKNKPKALCAVMMLAKLLGCQDLHYYDEPHQKLNLKPYYTPTIRVSKFLYFLQVTPISFEGDFIFVNSEGNILRESYALEDGLEELPTSKSAELPPEVPADKAVETEAETESDYFENETEGKSFSALLKSIDDEFEVEGDEWTTNLPQEIFEATIDESEVE